MENTISKISKLVSSLKNSGFKVYNEEMALRRAIGKHDSVLVELTFNEKEDMFDMFKSTTMTKILEKSVNYGTLPHYAKLEGYLEDNGKAKFYFAQDSAMLLAHYTISDFLKCVDKATAQVIEEGAKVIVFYHEKDKAIGFEGYVGRISKYAYDMAVLEPEKRN